MAEKARKQLQGRAGGNRSKTTTRSQEATAKQQAETEMHRHTQRLQASPCPPPLAHGSTYSTVHTVRGHVQP